MLERTPKIIRVCWKNRWRFGSTSERSYIYRKWWFKLFDPSWGRI